MEKRSFNWTLLNAGTKATRLARRALLAMHWALDGRGKPETSVPSVYSTTGNRTGSFSKYCFCRRRPGFSATL